VGLGPRRCSWNRIANYVCPAASLPHSPPPIPALTTPRAPAHRPGCHGLWQIIISRPGLRFSNCGPDQKPLCVRATETPFKKGGRGGRLISIVSNLSLRAGEWVGAGRGGGGPWRSVSASPLPPGAGSDAPAVDGKFYPAQGHFK